MQKIKIQSNIVYLLSGPSFSGKSYFTEQLLQAGMPEDAIISSDKIRNSILGSSSHLDQNGAFNYLYGWDNENVAIWDIIMKTFDIRLEQRLPIFIDSTNLTEADRHLFAVQAKKYNRACEVIVFDIPLEEIQKRAIDRHYRFFDTSNVLERQFEKFQKTSSYPYQIINQSDYEVSITPPLLDTVNIDVIGDIHGLKDEFLDMIKDFGWYVEDNRIKNRDAQRILLSLGDVLDRGPDGLEIIKLFMNSPQVQMLHGNHEEKIIHKYEQYQYNKTLNPKSISSSLTFKKLLNEDESIQKDIIQYLKNNEIFKILWLDQDGQITKQESQAALKIAFMHADVKFFHPFKALKAELIYGKRLANKRSGLEKDQGNNDEEYEKSFIYGINEYVVMRGHVRGNNDFKSIYSLEDNQAFKGNLVLLDLEKYVYLWLNSPDKQLGSQLFKDATVKYKTNYDFNEVIKPQIDLLKGFNELNKLGLVSDGEKKDENGEKIKNPFGFKVFKYSKKVHFKKLWKKHPLLEKARGIVMDSTGEIIVHPFDKIYNYEEYDTAKDLKYDQMVKVVEKLNGFMGAISLNPINKTLIYSTTGSINENAPFNQYLKSFVSEELQKKMIDYLKKNSVTLIFEVIHPEDPHVIAYTKEQMGIYLIGARGKNIQDQPWKEEAVDVLAQSLGLRRPWHKEMLFGELLENLKQMEIEGVMVRTTDDQKTLAKIKTDYYLTSKFLGRMSEKMVEDMYKKPEWFKSDKLDEEYFHIVDHIVKKIKKEDFLQMDQVNRVQCVRDIIDETRNHVMKESKTFKPR